MKDDYRIVRYKIENVDDVIDFENRLRIEDPDMGWDIDDEYKNRVIDSFNDSRFNNAVSLLYYIEDRAYGRIDASIIYSHFDGSTKAYLDWICVIPTYRGKGISRALMKELRSILKEEYNAYVLIGLMDENEACRRFYSKLENSKIKDEGIWIDL